MAEPTEKQLRVICFIESNLGIEFTGKTKEDAWWFIKMYLDESKEVCKTHDDDPRDSYWFVDPFDDGVNY